MEIKVTQDQYKILIRAMAISSHIYWIMWDVVDPNYKKIAENIWSLTDTLLQHNTDPKIEQDYNWKKDFSDEYMNDTMDDIIKYEDFAFFDLIVSRFAIEILWDKLESMDEDKAIKLISQTQEKLSKDISKNWLKNFKYIW